MSVFAEIDFFVKFCVIIQSLSYFLLIRDGFEKCNSRFSGSSSIYLYLYFVPILSLVFETKPNILDLQVNEHAFGGNPHQNPPEFQIVAEIQNCESSTHYAKRYNKIRHFKRKLFQCEQNIRCMPESGKIKRKKRAWYFFRKYKYSTYQNTEALVTKPISLSVR